MMKNITYQIVSGLSKARPVLVWLMCAYLAFVFIKNGWRKFDPEGFWGPAFEEWGFPVWFLFIIGVLETGGGILILIPKVRIWGALVIAVVMFGAITTRLIHGIGWSDATYILFVAVTCLYLASIHRISAENNKY